MKFRNKCGCVFDENMLTIAIKSECRKRNKKPKNSYQIFLRNGYPTICIAHDHCYVHVLVGQVKYGNIPDDCVIHHADFNKTNSNAENLLLMNKKEHLQFHAKHRMGTDYRSTEGKWRGINAARKARYRSDVKVETIIMLREQGRSYPQIAKILNCGENTVRRRIGAL